LPSNPAQHKIEPPVFAEFSSANGSADLHPFLAILAERHFSGIFLPFHFVSWVEDAEPKVPASFEGETKGISFDIC
jgi:hypothetical protein